MRFMVDAALRIIGALLIALGAARVCHDALDWLFFCFTLLGALFVMCSPVLHSWMTPAPEAPKPQRAPAEEETVRPWDSPQSDIDGPETVALTAPAPATPAPTQNADERQAAILTDLVSALTNLGVAKRQAKDIALAVFRQKPNASFEELFRSAAQQLKPGGIS